MANKYCNLDGSKKIKDEYIKINVGFDKVEEDINNIDTRVNNIITTPAEGVSAQEIIDARKGKPTLGAKIDEMDNDLAAHKAENVSQVGGVHGLEYEEGTWTPSLKFGGNNIGMTGSFSGRYTRIGNTVTVEFEINLTNKGTSEGVATIKGLPFTSRSTAPRNSIPAGIVGQVNFQSKGVYPLYDLTFNSTSLTIRVTQNNSGPLQLDNTDFADTSFLRCSLSYTI